MKKLSNKKGFTLAELLIVVAIIAVLVAVALPVFGNALENARLEADVSNLRSAYSEAVVAEMTAADPTDPTEGWLMEVTLAEAVMENGSNAVWAGTANNPGTVTVTSANGGLTETFTTDADVHVTITDRG